MLPTPPAAAWNRIVSPRPTRAQRSSRNSAVIPLSIIAAAVRSSIAGGQLHQPRRGHEPHLGVRPRQAGVGDAIADRDLGDAGPDRLDDARPLLPGDERQRGAL